MTDKRAGWASNLGFILAAAGSAIGLGNIWKFPGKVGQYGGGTFIAVYLCMVVCIGFSCMLAEITLGRHTQKNTVGAFAQIDKRWCFAGKLGILTAFIILSYYSVVGGWVLKYVFTYLCGADFGGDTTTYFTTFISAPFEPLVWHFIFMALTASIVCKGVSAGLEKISKLLMPILFLLLLAVTIRTLTLEGAAEGVAFLFSFDASLIDGDLIITALGQAFFSLSIGLGILITYGSYVSPKDSLPKSVASIVCLDTFIALLAGTAIICAVFATDKSLIGGQGGGFAFISLPNVFAQMPGGVLFGGMFFLLLFFAAFTSSMSLLEGLVAFVTEEYHLSRRTATLALATAMYLLGCGYSLSQGALNLTLPWFDVANGLQLLPMANVMELFTDNLTMPLGALAISLFVGWVWQPSAAIAEMRREGSAKVRFAPAWAFLIRYACPVAIATILIAGFVFGKALS
ncbi:MAG: sodium-dependent transporter [Faecalibacterium sp.]